MLFRSHRAQGLWRKITYKEGMLNCLTEPIFFKKKKKKPLVNIMKCLRKPVSLGSYCGSTTPCTSQVLISSLTGGDRGQNSELRELAGAGGGQPLPSVLDRST